MGVNLSAVLADNTPAAVTHANHHDDLARVSNQLPTTTTAQSANYTANPGDIVLVTAGGGNPIVITLPAVTPVTLSGGGTVPPEVIIKKVDNGVASVRVTPASGTIDGATYFDLNAQYSAIHVVSDGVNWQVV